MDSKPIEILLVEDSPGDVRLTIKALSETKVSNNLHVAVDGMEALAFLRRQGEYADATEPDLILLDLDLPRLNGRGVLAELKADPQLRHIPVVILTTSTADRDILDTYDLHANCYISKPINLEQFVSIVQSIDSFWLSIVKLPPREESGTS